MSGIMAVLAGMGINPPPAFVSASSAERTTNGTTLAITTPTGIETGDRLYVVLASDAGATVTAAASSGWSLVGRYNGSDRHMLIYSRTATGSEPASYTFTFSGTGDVSAIWGGAIVVYRGGQGVTDTVGTFTLSVGGGANTIGAPITPTANGTLLFFGARPKNTGSLGTAPAGMTQRVLDTSQPARFVYDLSPQAAEATGQKTFVWADNEDTIGVLVQIT